jgi:RNA polymerase-interacting CarD/CdnL/TRCF family regulator
MEYQPGDWIVHRRYGVGQVKKIEVKPINGEDTECLRVKIKDGFYWLPVGRVDNPRIRPVASEKHVKKAVKELTRADLTLEEDRKLWKKRIAEVKSDGNLVQISKLVRDLTLLRTTRRLNQTEDNALKSLTERMLREWSVCADRDIEALRVTLHTHLQDSKSQFEAE